jgi:hypothetical protein
LTGDVSTPVSLFIGKVSPSWLIQWAPVFSAVAVFVVGVIGVGIAFRQWHTARTKLQLDLYDRRRPIYDAVVAFIGEVLTKGVPTYSRMIELAQQTQGATFIFGPEIADYIRELERQGDDMRAAEVKLLSMLPGPDRTPFEGIILERQHWFQSQFQVLDRMFRPYLQLEARRIRLWPRWLRRDRDPPRQNLV